MGAYPSPGRRGSAIAGALLAAVGFVTVGFVAAAPARSELTVAAAWAPMERSKYGFQARWPLLRELAPAQAERRWSQEELAFLAPPAETKVGATWRLDDARLLALMRQLHAGASFAMHAMQERGGGHALLLARGPKHDVVRVRVHVDFDLDGKGSWFTPAQLAGDVVIERAGGRVVDLALRLPPAPSNVDLNWAQGEEKPDPVIEGRMTRMVEADIGFVPRLELVASGGGGAAIAGKESEAWEARIDDEEAARRLARCFYGFAEIRWLALDEAAAEARESGRPLHVVALFGALGDESC